MKMELLICVEGTRASLLHRTFRLKGGTDGKAISVDISRVLQVFEGEPAKQVIAFVQGGVPLSETEHFTEHLSRKAAGLMCHHCWAWEQAYMVDSGYMLVTPAHNRFTDKRAVESWHVPDWRWVQRKGIR